MLTAVLPPDPSTWSSLPLGALDSISMVGIVVLLGIALARGWLYTSRQVDDIRHDRDEWRAEGRIKDQTIAELTEQNNILLRDVAPAMTAFMQSLQKAGGHE